MSRGTLKGASHGVTIAPKKNRSRIGSATVSQSSGRLGAIQRLVRAPRLRASTLPPTRQRARRAQRDSTGASASRPAPGQRCGGTGGGGGVGAFVLILTTPALPRGPYLSFAASPLMTSTVSMPLGSSFLM